MSFYTFSLLTPHIWTYGSGVPNPQDAVPLLRPLPRSIPRPVGLGHPKRQSGAEGPWYTSIYDDLRVRFKSPSHQISFFVFFLTFLFPCSSTFSFFFHSNFLELFLFLPRLKALHWFLCVVRRHKWIVHPRQYGNISYLGSTSHSFEFISVLRS